MERNCLNGCSELIKTSPTRRLFCSDTCRRDFLKQFEGICYYCGDQSAEKDHLYPISIGHGVGETLPACADCNNFLSDKHANSHMRRLRALVDYLNGEYGEDLVSDRWSSDDIDEKDRGIVKDVIEQSVRLERLSTNRALHAYERLMEVLELQYPSASEVGTEVDDFGHDDRLSFNSNVDEQEL